LLEILWHRPRISAWPEHFEGQIRLLIVHPLEHVIFPGHLIFVCQIFSGHGRGLNSRARDQCFRTPLCAYLGGFTGSPVEEICQRFTYRGWPGSLVGATPLFRPPFIVVGHYGPKLYYLGPYRAITGPQKSFGSPRGGPHFKTGVTTFCDDIRRFIWEQHPGF